MTLDPGVRLVMDHYAGTGPAGTPTVAGAREGHEDKVNRFTPEETRPVVEVTTAAAVADDGHRLALQIYRPRASVPTEGRIVIWLHGGGWVSGSFVTADVAAREIADAGAIVVVPEYRLAPEHPFPAGLDDCLAVLRWTHEQAEELGGDPARISVGGDSAGGNLAAVLALHARDTGMPMWAQLLVYPVVDADYSGDRYPSRATYANGPLLGLGDMEWFVAQYLSGGSDPRDPRVSPVYAASLEGVAPAVVVTVGHDLLQDEGKAYAEALVSASVPVMQLFSPTLSHAAFDLLAASPVARATFRAAARAALELGHAAIAVPTASTAA